MKKTLSVILMLLLEVVVQAQTLIQPSNPSPDGMTERDVYNQVALAMTAICVTALIFYLGYMAVQKKGFWAKRRSQIMRHSE